jgi:quinol monooxygenase YgiN
MPIVKTAHFKTTPESLDIVEAAIAEFVAAVRENEPGTLIYLSVQSKDDPTRFMHYMEFEDNAAEELHQNSAAVRRFVDILYPNSVAGVEFVDHNLVATTQH